LVKPSIRGEAEEALLRVRSLCSLRSFGLKLVVYFCDRRPRDGLNKAGCVAVGCFDSGSDAFVAVVAYVRVVDCGVAESVVCFEKVLIL